MERFKSQLLQNLENLANSKIQRSPRRIHFPNLNLSMSQKYMSYEESTLQISILALESILSKENSRFARRKKILSSRKDTKGISENNR